MDEREHFRFTVPWFRILVSATVLAVFSALTAVAQPPDDHVAHYFVRGERIDLEPVPGVFAAWLADNTGIEAARAAVEQVAQAEVVAISGPLVEVRLGAGPGRPVLPAIRAAGVFKWVESLYLRNGRKVYLGGDLLVGLAKGFGREQASQRPRPGHRTPR